MAIAGILNVGSTNYPVGSTLYGTCETPAATAAKVAVVNGFDSNDCMVTGVTVHIKFTYANNVANPTLAIKATSSATTTTTAKSIMRYGTTAPSTAAATSWQAGSVVSFTYDGTYWQMNGWLNDNTCTDKNVKQTPTVSTNTGNYRLLMSVSADDTEHIEGTLKSSYALINPSSPAFTFGTRKSGTLGVYSFTEGYNNYASGDYSHAEGNTTRVTGNNAHAEGNNTSATNDQAHAEGVDTCASGWASHAEGNTTRATSNNTHAEGYMTSATAYCAHAEGWQTSASGEHAHAEGENTTAYGNNSHAEGFNTYAAAVYAHSEGTYTNASGGASHAEGNNTKASGDSSHAEGVETCASGYYAHAEGLNTLASSTTAHAEGQLTRATNNNTHAEGYGTTASGWVSHAEGYATIANHRTQHVFGDYNIADASTAAANTRGKYVEIVGNGTSATRSNARTLDWDGNEWIAGQFSVDGVDNTWLNIGKTPSIHVKKISSPGGVMPIIAGDTKGGRMAMATYPSTTNGNERLYFNYYKDATLSGTTNKIDAQFMFDGSVNQVMITPEGFGDSCGFRVYDSAKGLQLHINKNSHNRGLYDESGKWLIYADINNNIRIPTFNAVDYGNSISGFGNLELIPGSASAGHGGFIDFHFNQSTADYTHRLLASANNKISAYTSIANASDRRLKENIIDVDDKYVDLIRLINPKQYNFKTSKDNVDIGFIAQEVEDALLEIGIDPDKMPLIIKPVEDAPEPANYYSLDYGEMTAVLWKICQSQQKEIDDLKAQTAKLEKEIDELKTKLEK